MRPFGARGSAGEARRLFGSAAGQNPLSLFPWKKRKRFLMVSREKGLAAFRASPRTLAAPVTGVLARLSSGALPPVLSLDRNDSPGPARMLRPSLFAAAPWQFERAWRRVPPGCSSPSLFAAAPWQFERAWRPHFRSSAATKLRQQNRSRGHPGAPPTSETAMRG